jgi:hypothetical protein
MDLTLKNVKIVEAMSEETTCFAASIYIDGVRAGLVRNRGYGGQHEIDWLDKDLGLQYETWLKDQPVPFQQYTGMIVLLTSLHEKLEVTINAALDQWEDDRWLKRQCKSKILFKLKDQEKPSEWFVITTPWSDIARHRLEQRYGDNLGEIANERFV